MSRVCKDPGFMYESSKASSEVQPNKRMAAMKTGHCTKKGITGKACTSHILYIDLQVAMLMTDINFAISYLINITILLLIYLAVSGINLVEV